MKDMILILVTLAAFALVYWVVMKADGILDKSKKSKDSTKSHKNSGYGNYRK